MAKTKDEYLEKANNTKNKAQEKQKKTKDVRKVKSKNKEKKPGIFTRIKNYFKGVGSEMKKTKWPSKKEMALYASATLMFIVIFALFFTLNDVAISAFKQLVR